MLTAIAGTFHHNYISSNNNERSGAPMMTHAPPGAQNGASNTNKVAHQHNDSNQQPAMPSLHNVIIKGRWKIIETLGKGAFGEVYAAADMETNETVAIKVESPSSKKQVLKLEISVMRKLQHAPYVGRYIAAGRFTWPHGPPVVQQQNSEMPVYSYMVMEMLGQNLSELRKKCPHGKFSINTTALLGMQMVRGIESLHEIGILHRDIKPGNFCMSRSTASPHFQPLTPTSIDGSAPKRDKQRCYLIDYGLSRRFLNASGKVREARTKVGFRGTARYASINAHLGLELGRVDDMWSLFYLLVEFIKGSLPWKGKEKDTIGSLKQVHTSHDLLDDLPKPMVLFHDHLASLRYADRPDYDLLEGLMRSLIVLPPSCQQQVQAGLASLEDFIYYDWEAQEDPSLRSAALSVGSGNGNGGLASESGLGGIGSDSARLGGGCTSGGMDAIMNNVNAHAVVGGLGGAVIADAQTLNVSSSAMAQLNATVHGSAASMSMSAANSTNMTGALRRDPMSPSRETATGSHLALAVEGGERPAVGITIPGRMNSDRSWYGGSQPQMGQQPLTPTYPPNSTNLNGTSSSFGVGSLGSGTSNFMFGSPPAPSSAFKTLESLGRADSRTRSGMYPYNNNGGSNNSYNPANPANQNQSNLSQGSGNDNMNLMTGGGGDYMREDYEEDGVMMMTGGSSVPIIPGGYEDQDIVDCGGVADMDSTDLKSPPPLPYRAPPSMVRMDSTNSNNNRSSMDIMSATHPGLMPIPPNLPPPQHKAGGFRTRRYAKPQ
ncbi:Tau-tubulin kinase 2 [Chytridiales sp. JEL 0842]|nr:Tau-tubulin kinase 2 [Chytridiales sp. JEL 0842]